MTHPRRHADSARVQQLEDLIAKYTTAFPHHRPSAPAPSTEVAFVTGTTGGLGCALLVHLVSLPTVSRIYAFNRKDSRGRPLKERQAEGLTLRGMDASILDSPKVVLVEGDSTVPDLGVSQELFSEVSIQKFLSSRAILIVFLDERLCNVLNRQWYAPNSFYFTTKLSVG